MLPARDREFVQIVDRAFADAARRGGAFLACKPGCTPCCHGVFRISALDAERLREGLRQLAPDRAAAVLARARVFRRALTDHYPGDPATGLLHEEDERWDLFADMPAADAPCPALDPATGCCDLYAARPMTCRIFGPPVRTENGIGLCELCYYGASEAEILAGEMHLPHPELEQELDRELGRESETIVAWALLGEPRSGAGLRVEENAWQPASRRICCATRCTEHRTAWTGWTGTGGRTRLSDPMQVIVRCALLPLLTLPGISSHAQELPSAPGVPWPQPRLLHLPAPSREATLPQAAPTADAAHPLTLSSLIDIAEHRNPQTRAAWDAARQAAAEKGIARSALLPTLTGLVLSQTTRNGVLFGNSFVRQTVALYEPALELDYTLFDFNARLDALRAARYDLLAADFAFNDTHLAVMQAVATSYFELLNNQGQVAAAQINLQNAQAVAAEVDARLAQGLATLPDALQARAAAAQAQFGLVSLQGAQSNAQAALSAALELPPATPLPVVPIDRLALPEILSETAADAIARALENRPDLTEQEARVAAAGERIREARTAYYPRVTFSGNWGRIVRAYGQQDLLPPTYAGAGVWNVQANLSWTLFDGGRRSSDVARALAAQAASQARLDALRDSLEQQVWTAYTNTQTAFNQQQAAGQLLGAAQTSFDAATESFRYGVQTVISLISAQQALAQARSAEVSARANLFTQANTLLFRTGELLRSHNGPVVLPAPTNPQPPLTVPGKPHGGGY